MLVMDDRQGRLYVDDTIRVRILNDVDELHKAISKRERRQLYENDYHRKDRADEHNNCSIGESFAETNEESMANNSLDSEWISMNKKIRREDHMDNLLSTIINDKGMIL